MIMVTNDDEEMMMVTNDDGYKWIQMMIINVLQMVPNGSKWFQTNTNGYK